ncbi:MAG: hypothetical protein HY056_14070 [Proteobacteria bacterium]|nr:hypothetical protein [Pseudomonadota bacterium]
MQERPSRLCPPFDTPATVASRAPWSAPLRRGWHALLDAHARPRDVGARAPARRNFARPIVITIAAVLAVVVVAVAALLLRLASGPIALDMVTPWLKAAIEENFRGRRVEVGGTQLERDDQGRAALRIRDIVVRDADGSVVASAPRAEVGLSGRSLLAGRLRAERLSLVGAHVAVRVERDGQLSVFTSADKEPPASVVAADARAPAAVVATSGAEQMRRILSWIDRIGIAGFDGSDLTEVGVKNGKVSVEDTRNGRHWSFDRVDLRIMRAVDGEVSLSVGSEAAGRPWQMLAALGPAASGRRLISLEGQDVPFGDIVAASPLAAGAIEARLPMSIALRAEINADGTPERASGRVAIEGGYVAGIGESSARVAIDRAEFSLDWDAFRGVATMPFQVVSAGNRFTLIAQAEAPRGAGGFWQFAVDGGSVVLGPVGRESSKPLILDRVLVRGRCNPAERRIEVQKGELGSTDVALVFSGSLDFTGDDPRLDSAVAAGRMSVGVLKELWPVFANPKLREWVIERLDGGTVERVEIATNAPFSQLRRGGPPFADDALSVRVETRGSVIRPLDGLPAIREADLTTTIKGRYARVALGRGVVDLPSGRKLTLSSGVFEVPNTQIPKPPTITRFHIEGPVAAGAELVAMDALRDASSLPLDPAGLRGTVAANVTVAMPIAREAPPGSRSHSVAAEIANFSADRAVMGQKVESANLRITSNNEGYLVKGDVRIAGAPAILEIQKENGAPDPEVRMQAMLDEAARARLGFDFGGNLKGVIPIKLSGRMAAGERESRYVVEADLTQARIDQVVPGMQKAPGKAARASFAVVGRVNSTRLEDIVVEGGGSLLRGAVEVDGNGELLFANFPVFALSDGDKATLKAERGADSTLKITMRGDVYDGRAIVRSQMAGPTPDQRSRVTVPDLDLDIRLGVVAGHNGETLRGVDFRMSRRAGEIRSLGMNAKIGVDTTLAAELRARAGARPLIQVDTSDAGALLRFTDTYSRLFGGKLSLAMDPPSAVRTLQEGALNVRDFTIRGEQALDRIVTNQADDAIGPSAPRLRRNGIDFSRMYMEFSRSPGRLAIREGVVRGPIMGATIDGHIDYGRDEVRLRGTFVPLFGLNNMFGQLPIIGLFLGGGSNEGLVGITYVVVGPPGAPVLHVNPISAVAPGLLRKMFEFPNAGERGLSASEPR